MRQLKKPVPRMASVGTLVALALQGERGRYWYHDAKRSATLAAEYYDVPLWVYADYLALFSPRVSVKRSIRLAHYYVEHGHYHPTTMKGIRASVDHYENTGEIRGPKTAPFARALLGDERAIVLDVWMAKAFKLPQAAFSRAAVHERACGRVRKAARKLGWTPAQVQAAVWYATVKAAGKRPGVLQTGVDTLYGWHPETTD